MKEYPLLDGLRLGLEILAALVAFMYLPKLKNSYWKWFSFYLIFIAIQEVFWLNKKYLLGIFDRDYFAYIGIPIQYFFFYWLYALKSLKNKKLFLFSIIIYAISIPLNLFFETDDFIYSINISIGNIILLILVVLQFNQLIKSENILLFWKKKMFYINIGVLIFYVGTHPLLVFYDNFKQINPKILDSYYLYFLIANCLMYLLFITSFIWGKQKS